MPKGRVPAGGWGAEGGVGREAAGWRSDVTKWPAGGPPRGPPAIRAESHGWLGASKQHLRLRVRRLCVAIELDGVLPAHHPLFFNGDPGEMTLEQRLGVRPRRIGMRVVRFHHDVLDADDIAGKEPGRV